VLLLLLLLLQLMLLLLSSLYAADLHGLTANTAAKIK